MASLSRTRSHSIKETFSKLRRQVSASIRRDSREMIIFGVEVDSTESPAASVESSDTSYTPSEADCDDVDLRNALLPSPVLSNLVEEVGRVAAADRYGLLDEPFFDTTQPFRFLDLPPEIRLLVYRHYFPEPGASIRVKKSASEGDFIVQDPWRGTLALLLTCREVYEQAVQRCKLRSMTLDLSQYTVPQNELLPISSILASLGEAGTKITRLIISREQPWNLLEPRLFPLLRSVEVWDYGYWRSVLYTANSARVAADFGTGCRNLLASRARAILSDTKTRLPAGVAAEVNLVCDMLVCVGTEIQAKQDKLRHIIRFSDDDMDGKHLRPLWVTRAAMTPLPLRFQIAPHMHEYCLHLHEHDQELISHAS